MGCFWLFVFSAPAAVVKIVRTSAGGWQLQVDGKLFLVKGVVYNPVPPGKDYSYNFWADLDTAASDGELMQKAGFNVVRFYTAGENLEQTKKFIHLLYEKYGIYTIMGDWLGFWNSPAPYYADKDFQERVKEKVLKVVRALKDEPGILMWILGNENNYSFSGKINFWTSPQIENIKDPAERVKRRAEIYYGFVEDLARAIKQIDNKHPIALGNGELIALDVAAKYLKDIDALALIFYRGKNFGNIFTSVRKITDKPVLISEFGCDAYDAFRKKEDQDMQAEFLLSQWEDIFNHTSFSQARGNCLGGVIFEWNDEWWKYNPEDASRWGYHDTLGGWSNGSYYFDIKAPRNLNMNEEWFGLLSFEKTPRGSYQKVPRKAYYVLREFFRKIGQLNVPQEKSYAQLDSNYEKARQLFLQLQDWQNNKDWQNFFDHKDEYKEQILSLLKAEKTLPLYFRLKADYLKWKLFKFLKSEDTSSLRQKIIEEVKLIGRFDRRALSALQRIIFELSQEKEKGFRHRLLRAYIESIEKFGDKDFIKEEAERFWRERDLRDSSQLYKVYLNRIKDRKELRRALREAIDKFSFDGCKKNYEGYFAEEAFEKFIDAFGKDNLSEDYFYLRGYNLEKISEAEKAAEVYREFLERFPDSLLREEVIFRLGFINFYKLKDFSTAKEYFSQLLSSQAWQKEAENQINLLESKTKLSYNQKIFFQALYKKLEVAPNSFVSLSSFPARAQTRERLEIKSISLSSDTGCLAPRGVFLWSGDLGEVKITTNTPYIATSFKEPGLKIVNVVQALPEVLGGVDSDLVNIYQTKVVCNGQELSSRKDNVAENKDLKVSVDIFPSLPASFVKFKWYLKGAEEASSEKDVFNYQVESSGEYELTLGVYFLRNKFAEKRFRIKIK